MNTELRRKDDEMVYDLEKRFDRHLEIYAKNGIELAGLKEAVKNLTNIIHEYKNKDDIYREEMKPILDSYKAITTGRSLLMGFIGLCLAVGSLFLMVKQIIK